MLNRTSEVVADCEHLASDVYFARRTVLLATMPVPGTPSALAKEAGELLSQLLPTANTDPSGPGIKDSLDELCPACHASIPLQDADSAVCPNGHVWGASSAARCCLPTARSPFSQPAAA